MMALRLVHPAPEHRGEYEAMMDEWEAFGGRLNPGALRRYSKKLKRNVSYDQWLMGITEDRKTRQDLYFLMSSTRILGAISIRFGKVGQEGHCGYGIRPSERRKGYAAEMLSMALSIMKDQYGIDTVLISCAEDNIASEKTILKNGGVYLRSEPDEDDGEMLKLFEICL